MFNIFIFSLLLLIVSGIVLKTSVNKQLISIAYYIFIICTVVACVSFMLWIAIDDAVPFWIKFWILS